MYSGKSTQGILLLQFNICTGPVLSAGRTVKAIYLIRKRLDVSKLIASARLFIKIYSKELSSREVGRVIRHVIAQKFLHYRFHVFQLLHPFHLNAQTWYEQKTCIT